MLTRLSCDVRSIRTTVNASFGSTQKYVPKAKEADERANAAKDEFLRRAWEHIAANYRELARTRW